MSETFKKWWGVCFQVDAFEPKIIAELAFAAGQNQRDEEVEELKRKLFNEGVKNNSNVARVEFLEDKIKDVEKVTEAARECESVLKDNCGDAITHPADRKLYEAIRAFDSEGRLKT
jgi:hypothetical protein